MWTQKRTFPFAHLPGDPEAAIPVATPEALQTSNRHTDEDDAVLVTHASQSRFITSLSYVVVPLSSDEQAVYRRYFVAPEMDPTTEGGEEELSKMNSNNIAYPQCVELFLLGFSDGTVGCYRIAPSHLRWHPAVSPPFTPFPLHHDDQQQVMSLSTLGTLVLSCGADGVAQLSMIDVTPVLRSTPSSSGSSSVLGKEEEEIIATPSPTRVASIATLPAIHRHGENGESPVGLRCGLLWEGASHWACAPGESSAVYIFTGDDQGRVVLYRVDVLTKTWFIHSVFAPIVYGAQGDYRAVTLSAKDCPAPRWLESPIFCLTLDSEAVEAVRETTDNDDRRTTTSTTTHVRLVAGGDRRLFVWDLSHIPLRQTFEEGPTDRTQTASNNMDAEAVTALEENERLRKKSSEEWDTPLVASQTLWNRYVWLQPPPSPPSSASTSWFGGGDPKEVSRAIKRWRQASNAQALGIVVNHSIHHHHRTEKNVESGFPRPKETTNDENGGNNSSDAGEPIVKTSQSTQVAPQTTPSPTTVTTTTTVTVLFDDRKRSVEAPLFAVRYVQIPILCAQISHGVNGGAVRAMVRLHEGVLVTGDDAGVLSVWAWNVMEEKYVGVTSTQQPSKKDSREGEHVASTSSKSVATQQPSVEGPTSSSMWLRGHRRAVRSLLHFPVANSPLRFVSTSLDGFVKVWSLTTPPPPTSSSVGTSAAASADGTALPRLQLEVNSVLRLEAAAGGSGAVDLPASAATRPTVGVGCAVVFPPFLVLFATAEFDATVRAFQFLEVSGCAPPPGMMFDGVRTVRVNNNNTAVKQKEVSRQGDEATLPARHVDPLANCHRDGDRHEVADEANRFVSERFGTRSTEDEDCVAPPGVEMLLGSSSSISDDEVGEENPNKPSSQQQRLRNDSTSDSSSSSSDDEEEGDVTGLGCVPTVQDVLCEHNLEKKRKEDNES